MSRGNDFDEKQSTEASEVNPETLGKCCFSKCIIILGRVNHCLGSLQHYFWCKRYISNWGYFLIP